jgi:DNA mismatch repair protein MutS
MALEVPRVLATAQSIAVIDVLAALAQVAAENRYTAPLIDNGERIKIIDGRHPVIEHSLSDETFVPNDTHLNRGNKMVGLITGPNMSGKSTYIRQTALIVLLAQMGSYVPAGEAAIGVVDRIFTRIGSADDLSRGASTFMVEMVEIANILNNATAKSLVVLDEVGRGTSTFDGVALAWAIVEHIHNVSRARTLFATHYHQLTDLSETLEGVHNLSVAVREWEDEIIFLHRIVEGGTDRSYGIQVARLAGVPAALIERAKIVLGELEGTLGYAAGKNSPEAKVMVSGEMQLGLFGPEPSVLDEAVKDLDPENMTPMEALAKVRELKDLI